ncbi:hypothetical protein [Quadrisphaera sp. DSM 44207]|uniref:hypothetical protein n=1 Tax=Quadrisphaera sp. DSM 44207 TaxID=1881057 RepID=UPI000B80EA2B|nr:hypothetical protein [Quadrisphaera sp. DSM 44207]
MSSMPVASGPSALPAAVSAPLPPEDPTAGGTPPPVPAPAPAPPRLPAPAPRAAPAISSPTPVVTWAPRPARTAGPTTGPMSVAVPAAVPAGPPASPAGAGTGDDRLALRTRCRLRAEPASVPEARRFVGDALINASERGISSLDVALLLTSELTSFVIRRGAADSFSVDVAASVNKFLVVVTEQTPPWMLPGTMEAEGRQLKLVAELAESWGITASPGAGESCWFRLAI